MSCIHEGRTTSILPPPQDSGAIMNFRDNWETLVGLVGPMSGKVRAIINVLMHYPRTLHEARQSYKRSQDQSILV
jgi:hypothetical protein